MKSFTSLVAAAAAVGLAAAVAPAPGGRSFVAAICTGNGPPASVVTTGEACGASTIHAFGSPALGSPLFGIEVHSVANSPAALFIGVLQPGVPVGGDCMLRLDAASIASPFVFGSTDMAGNLVVTAAIPQSSALAGCTATFQGAVVVPNGPIAIGVAGFGLGLTEAMTVTLGY